MSADPTNDVEVFRPRLLGLAYRMLGTVADAEDAVQDAYLRLHQASGVEAPEAWLVKTTTRLCIDRLRQLKRRETYIGEWLPEPVSASWDGAERDRLELAESLSMAFLVMLETLSPAERAAYLLREVFAYDFDEIATLLDKSAVNVRQITARAKKRLDSKERRFHPDPHQADEFAERFFTACRTGDMSALESLVSEDAVFYSDGGGKAHAAPRPFSGLHRITNLLEVVFRKRASYCTIEPVTVNNQPGVVFRRNGEAVQVMTFASEGGKVRKIYNVLNPDKLQRWSVSNR